MLPNFMAEKLIINYEDYKLAVEKLALTIEKNYKPSVLVGIIFNETIGFSFYSLGLSVGFAVTLMVYLRVMHPPAASNPLVVLFTDVSFEYILFPVILGTSAIIIMSILINKVILKRKYPNKGFWLY